MIDPQRGEVWYVDLDPTRGSEQAKVRPCVVLSPSGLGRLPVRIVIPITGWNPRYKRYTWMVQIDPDRENGLTKASTADGLQIRTVDLVRFRERIGALPKPLLERIAAVVAFCIAYQGTNP